MKMVLKTLSVGELRSPNSTARQHKRQQRKKARALFSEHGIVVPIIVDERMQIIDGILRFEIAKELGLQELNAVVVSDATEAKLLQLELSLNRLAEDGAWDTERLKSKFEQLIEYNVDLTFTGFETAEIDNILKFEVVEPEDQNWYMECPHGKWMKRITALISEYTFHGNGFDQTYRWVLTMPPKNGWDSETLGFVKTAIRLALRECWHDR